MNLLLCYFKCSTCKKAISFLDSRNIEYKLRDIKQNNPTKEELNNFIKLSKKDINNFFNTSGLIYRNLNLKDKLKNMSYDDKLELLSSNGMLVKRPIFVFNNEVLIGFKEKEWEDKIK